MGAMRESAVGRNLTRSNLRCSREPVEIPTPLAIVELSISVRQNRVGAMKNALRILRLEFFRMSPDCGLLLLRLWLGLSLLLLHGSTKLANFSAMSEKFGDPLGIGSKASLSLAVFGEVVGSILVILGLFTRLGALSCMITMGVAFLLVHKLHLKGPGNGELAFIYLAGFMAIFLAGPGRFALDAKCCRPKQDGGESRTP